MTVVKELNTSKYTVTMFLVKDKYQIKSLLKNGVEKTSNLMTDFKLATIVFDMTIEELEGN